MFNLHPSYLEKNGKPEFVILSVEEYESLKAYLEDVEDLLELRTARHEEAQMPTISLETIKEELGLNK